MVMRWVTKQPGNMLTFPQQKKCAMLMSQHLPSALIVDVYFFDKPVIVAVPHWNCTEDFCFSFASVLAKINMREKWAHVTVASTRVSKELSEHTVWRWPLARRAAKSIDGDRGDIGSAVIKWLLEEPKSRWKVSTARHVTAKTDSICLIHTWKAHSWSYESFLGAVYIPTSEAFTWFTIEGQSCYLSLSNSTFPFNMEVASMFEFEWQYWFQSICAAFLNLNK